MYLGKIALLAAACGVVGVLAMLGVVVPSEAALRDVFHSLAALEREEERSQQLDEELRTTIERSMQIHLILQGLIRQELGLREAVGLFRPLCQREDMLSIRNLAPMQSGSEEEVLALHLLRMVKQELKFRQVERQELLFILEQECALIQKEHALQV